MPPAVIAFLTDYGLGDDFVGVCHGVILGACPEARIIDVTHGIAPHDVRSGALVLARSLPYVPAGVWLAVVDPGVGGPRRGVAVRARDGRCFVGPDNGLLSLAIGAAGGAAAAVDLADSPRLLRPLSATFHGRDMFAPVAAALAGGADLEQVGSPIEPASLDAITLPGAEVQDGCLIAHVLTVDGFGNLALDGSLAALDAAGIRGEAVRIGELRARVGRTFADVDAGELLLYADGYGMLALAVNRGSAARRLGAGPDSELRIVPA